MIETFNFVAKHINIFKYFPYLFTFLLLAFYYKRDLKLFVIRRLYKNPEKKVILYLMHKHFKKLSKNKSNTPLYILEKFFKGEFKIPRTVKFEANSSVDFWREVYNKHKQNLILCLERKKTYFQDAVYFEHLITDRFENSLEHEYNEEIFSKYIAEAKSWAFKKKNQAARLGAIAFLIKLTNCDNCAKPKIQMQQWNTVLGLYKNEQITEDNYFNNPFYTKGSNVNPQNVYNQGLDLLKFVIQLDLTKAVQEIKKKLGGDDFKKYNFNLDSFINKEYKTKNSYQNE